MPEFEILSKMVPKGDQPPAIEKLAERLGRGERYSTLLGVTGSGKTFTMAHAVARVKKPTLVITHNKTLAAQLYAEFKDFFPKNAVHYFVSYYDYYQPEAYIPQRDIYIEKDADINEDIDRLRLAATSALLSRRDVIVVASVSCIYGLGSPEDYRGMIVPVRKGEKLDRHALARKLVDIQYERSDLSERGKFRVRGDTVEMRPSYLETGIRVEFDGDVVSRVTEFHGVSGAALLEYDDFVIYPAKHFVMPEEKINNALYTIEIELEERLKELEAQGKLLEAQRLKARTKYDLELLREVGYCKGIENYSRHLSGRRAGEPPATLLDYFPKGDFLCIVDESHATVPQLHGMYNGDRARKQTLVDYGFRLPSALDNRPLRFEEWEAKVPQVLFVSATPSEYEIKRTRGEVVEQIIRPTGLVDPEIEVRPARGQVPDLMGEIKARAERKERALVTTLTKRLAEDLSGYLQEEGVRGKYLHSEIQTFERVEILRELREGKFDVLVGVNLLREGLDLPEVTLVAILDADKEGFLRSSTSIIQTVGRTARNVNGRVILYADQVTDSMKRAMDETARRRAMQLEYNRAHGVTPQTIEKEIRKGVEEVLRARKVASEAVRMDVSELDRTEAIGELEKEMYAAAEALDFERAARLRDAIRQLTGEMAPAVGGPRRKPRPRGPRIHFRP